MDAEELFLHVNQDLYRRVYEPASEYDTLGIARLVRQLLLNGQPLMDKVNRERRMRIRFLVNVDCEVTDEPDGLPKPYLRMIRALSPSVMPMASGSHLISREQFLRLRCVERAGERFTIHEIVDLCAHVLGGVHTGEPHTPHEIALHAMGEEFRFNDVNSVISMLPPIGIVVLEALEPLCVALTS